MRHLDVANANKAGISVEDQQARSVATIPLDHPAGYIQRVGLAVLGFMLFGTGLAHLGFLANDPDESYDVAAENPQIVAQIQDKISTMLQTFPDEVQKAWADTKARRVNPNTPAGAYPQPAP